MKICLINLPSPWLISDRDNPSMGILWIAGFLRQFPNLRIDVCDLAGLEEKEWMIPDCDIYGISTTTPQYPYALKVIKKLRERQKCTIVVGGIHPTVLPQQTLEESGADYVVVGEGEFVMKLIADGQIAKGIVVAEQIRNLGDLPLPAIDMIDIYTYMQVRTNSFIAGAKREAYIQTARGCPYNCSFCCQRKMWRGNVRYRPLWHIQREIEHMLEVYNVDQIYFNDDTFILSYQRVLDFCNMIAEMRKKYNFIWHCLSRVDKSNCEIFRIMSDSGCRGITFGVESGSQTILNKMNKNVKVAEICKAIREAKLAGMKVRCQLIVGFPEETDNTVEETADLIRELPADVWGIHAFVPFPGCDVWNNPTKYQFKLPDNIDYGDFHTIGKPGEWHKIINPNEDKVRDWLAYLQKTAGEKNIYKQIKV